jgi:hypothetical protein
MPGHSRLKDGVASARLCPRHPRLRFGKARKDVDGRDKPAMTRTRSGRSLPVIASEAKQSMSPRGDRWIASSQGLLAMTAEGAGVTNSTRRANQVLIYRNHVKPRNQKYSAGHVGQITGRSPRIPAHKRGASRSPRCVGWAAMDAFVQVRASVQTTGRGRTAKSCGPDAAMLASSP